MDKIKEIHQSNAYGILIETGCGLAVSSALLEVADASKTIYFSECPYSKEYQLAKYGEVIPTYEGQTVRSVSMENVRHIINYYKTASVNYLFKHGKAPDININFTYVSSFQIGEHNDKSTHGWIGIRTFGLLNHKTFFFHISIHESLSRKEYISKISEIGINLLYHFAVEQNQDIPSNCCIDDVLNNFGDDVPLEELLFSLRNENTDNFICVKDGKRVRMEDLFRDQKTILLYKGSFNPVHVGHIFNAEQAANKYGTTPVFIISSSVYQKGWVEPNEINHRVEMLNALGYPVIITKHGYFNENTQYIRKKFKQPIVYVVGSDTLNRIMESSYHILNPEHHEHYKHLTYQLQADRAREISISNEVEKFEQDFNEVTFFVINRPGYELKPDLNIIKKYYTLVEEHPELFHISSTKIRELLKNNDTEEIKKLIPEKILELYINKNNNYVEKEKETKN